MKNALVSENEQTYWCVGYDMSFTPPKPIMQYMGWRVVDVMEQKFPVELPLFWQECGNNFTLNNSYYNETTKLVELLPPLPPFPDVAPVEI